MRTLLMVSLGLAISACSGAKEEKKAEAAAAAMEAGQWDVTSEIISVRAMDKGAPAFNAKAGDKSTSSVCIGKEAKADLPTSLFTGDDDACKYQNSYVRNGRLSASLICNRDGMRGDITRSVDGRFTADGFDATVTTSSFLVSDGDMTITAKLAGRRTGDCTEAEPAKS